MLLRCYSTAGRNYKNEFLLVNIAFLCITAAVMQSALLSISELKCLFVVCVSDVKFEIDLPKKLVWIESDKDVDVLMETLKKCGKEVKYNGTK